MYCTRKITDDIYYVGGSDRRLAQFENLFPIPRGVAYNSYLLVDEKTVLFDTVDSSITNQFLENIFYVLENRSLDYLVVNHMEPDHCSVIQILANHYPDMKIICNQKTLQIIKQFFVFDIDSKVVIIKEEDEISLGKHTLKFYMAPMVHWPETMVTYDMESKILFAGDAFGAFGALSGNIFNDELDIEKDWIEDIRRYYTNIVGKYGLQVQALLKKAANLEIDIICPLHGPIWRSNLEYMIEKYDKWSRYEPEDKNVMIAYGSMYNNTENVVQILATQLAEAGVKNIVMYDVSSTHVSTLIAEAFRCSHLVLAAPTYNGGIYPVMENFLMDMKALNLQNRTVAIIENGSWASIAGKKMRGLVEEMKGMTILEETITLKSTLKPEQLSEVDNLKNKLLESLK